MSVILPRKHNLASRSDAGRQLVAIDFGRDDSVSGTWGGRYDGKYVFVSRHLAGAGGELPPDFSIGPSRSLFAQWQGAEYVWV